MLFDELDRPDLGPRRYTEDTYSFLNRATGAFWERIRIELDRWYAAYPDDTGDLLRRFRSRDHRQHYGARWELYLHQILISLGFGVTPHPHVPGSSGRPDFLATGRRESFYVEAVTEFSGIAANPPRSALEPAILDVINQVDASDFFVSVRFSQIGTSMPRRTQITGPITAWLKRLEPDARRSSRVNRPEMTLRISGWIIELRALTRAPEFRGRPNNRLVGTQAAFAGYTNDREQLFRALERKKKQHGTPDRPLIIAANVTNGFVDDDVVIDALFGNQSVRLNTITGASSIVRNPDGFWIGTRGPASKKVSAVLIGVGILPETCARAAPRLWHHFAPDRQLKVDLPFATARIVDDELRFADAKTLPHDLLGLTPEWPGPGPPFGSSRVRLRSEWLRLL